MLDWQQKAAALDALSELNIKLRGVDDWYVDQRVEVKDGDILIGTYGNGRFPEEAIADHWRVLVEDIANSPKYLVARRADGSRRAAKWNGFMWADVPERTP